MFDHKTIMATKEKMNNYNSQVITVLKNISAESIAWVAIIFIHLATVPGLFAVMSGYSSELPPADIVLMTWTSLILFLVRAAIKRDILQMFTIGIGFAGQATMMVLLFFK